MKNRLFLVAGLVAAMFVLQARAATSAVHDPTGDGVGSPAPYLDVVQAEVIEQRGKETLLFMMQLAGPIPEAPSESDLIWPFHVDTNRDTDPATFPGGLYNEHVVRVRWFGGAFVGQVVERTPLLTGRGPIFTSVPFSIDGPTVKVFVPLGTLGSPSSFGWNAATRPGATAAYVDFAPDAAGPKDFSTLATWTQEATPGVTGQASDQQDQDTTKGKGKKGKHGKNDGKHRKH